MRTIELKVSHADLMGEAAKWSYTIGENVGDDAMKARHFVQGATDAGHRDLLKAAMDDAWAEVLQVLMAYTIERGCGCGCEDCQCKADNPSGDSSETETFDTQWCADYEATLTFPDNTYPTLGQNIARLVRRYMTMKMRAEWENLTRQNSQVSEAQAEQAIRRLKVEVSTRTTVGKTKGAWRYGY